VYPRGVTIGCSFSSQGGEDWKPCKELMGVIRKGLTNVGRGYALRCMMMGRGDK